MTGVKVLVTTDGSNLSDKAIETAVELTAQLGGELIGMTSVVAPPPEGGFDAEDAAVRDRLAAISRKAEEKAFARNYCRCSCRCRACGRNGCGYKAYPRTGGVLHPFY